MTSLPLEKYAILAFFRSKFVEEIMADTYGVSNWFQVDASSDDEKEEEISSSVADSTTTDVLCRKCDTNVAKEGAVSHAVAHSNAGMLYCSYPGCDFHSKDQNVVKVHMNRTHGKSRKAPVTIEQKKGKAFIENALTECFENDFQPLTESLTTGKRNRSLTYRMQEENEKMINNGKDRQQDILDTPLKRWKCLVRGCNSPLISTNFVKRHALEHKGLELFCCPYCQFSKHRSALIKVSFILKLCLT